MARSLTTPLIAGALLVALTACSGDSTAGSGTESPAPETTPAFATPALPDPVTQAQPSSVHGFVGVSGKITWDDSGCVRLPDHFVVLPYGAKFSDDGQSILLEDGNVIEKNTHIEYVGGYSPAGKGSEAVERGCVASPKEEVAFAEVPKDSL